MRDRPDCSYIPIKPEVLANFGRAEAAWHKPPAGGGSGSARERPRAADCSAYIGGKMLSFAFFLFLFISFESRLSGARPTHSESGSIHDSSASTPIGHSARSRVLADGRSRTGYSVRTRSKRREEDDAAVKRLEAGADGPPGAPRGRASKVLCNRHAQPRGRRRGARRADCARRSGEADGRGECEEDRDPDGHVGR